jgi:hypothetical protein
VNQERRAARQVSRRGSSLRLPWATAAAVCLLAWWAVEIRVAAAEQPQWEFELTIQAPIETGDSFVLELTPRLVSPQLGVAVPTLSVMYRLVGIAPSGDKRVLADHATAWANVTGARLSSKLTYVPRQNGQWTFQVWQLDGANETLVVERQASTDRAVVSAPTLVQGLQFVSEVRVEPAQPIVGQPATITVQIATPQTSQVIHDLPVSLVDDDGVLGLGTVSPDGTSAATLVWTPQRVTANGLLIAGEVSVPIVVADAASAPAPGEDTTTLPGPPTDDGEVE